MEAVRFREFGGPEVLAVESVARPEPADDEVLIAAEAAAVNPVDTYIRQGAYGAATPPWIPGCDVAGVVEAVGDRVYEVAVGDRVVATGLGKDRQGTCAEYVAVPADDVAALPEGVGFAAGAAVALVGVTAWDALVRACDLTATERCLIHGGSGGVGHVAVQIAAAAGADVTATASSQYHDRLRGLGAEDVLDYRRDDLAGAIAGAGAPDVVLDHRLDEYLPLDVTVAGHGARIAAIGNEDDSATFPDALACRDKALSLHHVSMFNVPAYRPVLGRLGTLLARGDLTPVVERTYDLAEVADAQRAVRAESFLGKLVVDI